MTTQLDGYTIHPETYAAEAGATAETGRLVLELRGHWIGTYDTRELLDAALDAHRRGDCRPACAAGCGRLAVSSHELTCGSDACLYVIYDTTAVS